MRVGTVILSRRRKRRFRAERALLVSKNMNHISGLPMPKGFAKRAAFHVFRRYKRYRAPEACFTTLVPVRREEGDVGVDQQRPSRSCAVINMNGQNQEDRSVATIRIMVVSERVVAISQKLGFF